MVMNVLGKISVLVMRDQTPSSSLIESEDVEGLLEHDTKFSVSVTAAAYGEGARTARQQRPDIVIIDGVNSDPDLVVAEIDEAMPRASIIVILDEEEADRAHDCILAGARACLQRPVPGEELIRTIIQLHTKALRRRKQFAQGGSEQRGHLIAVRGAKGGVGTTVIAANLAIALQRASDRRVALVDANLFGGDVALVMDLLTNRSLTDLIPDMHALTPEVLESSVVRHKSGVDVLPAPNELERAESVTPEHLQRVLEGVNAHYDFVVVDTSSLLDQSSLVVLDLASVILLICTPQITGLKNAARFLKLAGEFGYGEEKVRLVINRHGSPASIGDQDIEHHLHYPITAGLPNDREAVVHSLNRGEPVMITAGKSALSRAIYRLAELLLQTEGWSTGVSTTKDKMRPTSRGPLAALKGLPAALKLGSSS
jgi:pilus assembly protein CpaE